jgi:hypothetical protein
MPDVKAQSDPPPRQAQSWWRKLLWRIFLLIVVGMLVAQLLNYSARTINTSKEPASFSQGVLHGAMMPCTLPALALGQEVEIYAARNTGRSYKLGYVLGVNLCGAIFFGLLYRRWHKWQAKRQNPALPA